MLAILILNRLSIQTVGWLMMALVNYGNIMCELTKMKQLFVSGAKK